jgi:hypothetical protein
MTADRISVVLPVFNEQHNIAACLTGLERGLAGVEHEILVCYDFDEDTTLAGIRAMGADAPRSLRLVKNTLGRGPHNALKAGFAAASGDVVVTTMADLSDPPELIPVMAEKVRAGADVVSGSRYMPGGSQHGGPLLKRTLSRIAGVSLAWVAGMGTCDATSNFRAYSTRFLRRTTIEATAGFEIALELTVKAHLSGAGVGEVPSSWVDRTAGESRFRLWKWLPNYLRWYLQAMLEPAAVWAVLVLALALVLARLSPAASEAARLATWTWAGAAALLLLAARGVRGRTSWIDLLIVAAWLAPPVLLAGSAATAALTGARLAASVLVIGMSAGWSRLATALRRVVARLDFSLLGLGLLALCLWSTHVGWVQRMAGSELDLSWQQSLGRALREGLGFGSRIVFTYGPLGYFFESPYDPDLYWTKTLAFEIGLKLVSAGFIAACAWRLQGRVARVAFAAGAVLLLAGSDAWNFLVCASIGAWYCARPERGVLHESLGTLVLVLLALVKFTNFLLAALVWLVFALWCWRSRGGLRALRTPVIAALMLLAVWVLVGQSPLDLPRYVWSSLAITGAYSSGMGQSGDGHALASALVLLALILAVCALVLARRARPAGSLALMAIVLAGSFLAFKAGFVRSLGNSVSFFGFAALAPFLLGVPHARASTTASGGWERARAGAVLVLQLAILVLATRAYGQARQAGSLTWQRLYTDARAVVLETVTGAFRPRSWRLQVESESAPLFEQTALPHVRAAVGDASIDLLGNSQGTLHANHLHWTPRPAFQSYLTFTRSLLERNARFLAGDQAPRFLLYGLESIDNRLPGMDDTLALQVAWRDYRAVLEEGAYLLLEREPPRPASAPARETQLERTVHFGEWVEIGDPPGACHLLYLDIRTTAPGRLATALLRSPTVWMSLEDSSKRSGTFRIVPEMMTAGVPIDPFMITSDEVLAWFTGGPHAHVKRLRVELRDPETEQDSFEPEIGLRVVRADDLQPRAASDVQRTARFPMMVTQPGQISTRFPWYPTNLDGKRVLVVHAPSELAFQIGPGSWRVRGRYGLLPMAWERACSDGVNFAVLTLDPDKVETLVFKRLLDPRAVEAEARAAGARRALPAAGGDAAAPAHAAGAVGRHELRLGLVDGDRDSPRLILAPFIGPAVARESAPTT